VLSEIAWFIFHLKVTFCFSHVNGYR
jgi:hypothetical protein